MGATWDARSAAIFDRDDRSERSHGTVFRKVIVIGGNPIIGTRKRERNNLSFSQDRSLWWTFREG